ncbi:hypothetical protein H0H92_004753 [Tricholoma furcatifolium]|nr:hypothetical protein H0H92_004753 [Tricholoma furcatifolium]
MARARLQAPASESEDETSPPPPKSTSKRHRNPSKKQNANDKENMERAEAALLRAQKKIKKLCKTQLQDAGHDKVSDDSNIETEDDDDILFSSSVHALEPASSNQAHETPLRRAPRANLHLRGSLEPDLQILLPAASRSSPLSSVTPANKRLRSSSDSTNLDESDTKRARSHILEVTLAAGVKLSDKPNLTNFNDLKVQGLLSVAIKDYECKIITQECFPDLSRQLQLTRLCWDEAQARRGRKGDDGNVISYELTDRMIRLIKSRGSRVRGTFLKDARNEVKSRFGFNDGGSARQVAKNLTIFESLVKKDEYFFHYKDVKTRSGYGDNPTILNILAAVCFADETAFGVVYPGEFNPITIETLAFVFTLIYHCIKEWSTGKRVKTKFTETDNAKYYKIFYADLLKWKTLNETATQLKRVKMYERACRKGGITNIDDPVLQLQGEAEDRARKELEEYTGETESEGDDEQDHEEDSIV